MGFLGLRLYLASIVGDGSPEGALDVDVEVDGSLSGLGLRSFGTNVSSVEPLAVVAFGVVLGVVKLDLIPELSFLARLCRGLLDFFGWVAGVL